MGFLMRPLVAATVTLEDLKNYFKGTGVRGSTWRATVRDDGTLEARGNYYLVELTPGGSPSFLVKIQAHEDESDKDEAVTDEPMKFLVDFLKTGTAGDEALQKMARTLEPAYQDGYVPPVVVANLLRAWAIDVEKERIGPRATTRLLRRASLLPDWSENIKLLRNVVRMASRAQIEAKEMQKLADEMTKKGWRVKAGKNDRDLPEITADIAGVYEAKIEIDHMPWKYSFEIHEHPETKAEGITDDPITLFEKYAKTDKVSKAKSDLDSSKSEKAKADVSEGTVAPKKKRPHEDFESGAP